MELFAPTERYRKRGPHIVISIVALYQMLFGDHPAEIRRLHEVHHLSRDEWFDAFLLNTLSKKCQSLNVSSCGIVGNVDFKAHMFFSALKNHGKSGCPPNDLDS